MNIFLDLDGVLADFSGSVSAHLNLGIGTDWPKWAAYDGQMTDDEFWTRVRRLGSNFWASLPTLPWAHELIAACLKHDPHTHLLTSGGVEGAAVGKAQWVRTVFPAFRSRLLITSHKDRIVKSQEDLLIDDYEKNVTKVREAGGQAWLLKRTWNQHDPSAMTPAQVVTALS